MRWIARQQVQLGSVLSPACRWSAGTNLPGLPRTWGDENRLQCGHGGVLLQTFQIFYIVHCESITLQGSQVVGEHWKIAYPWIHFTSEKATLQEHLIIMIPWLIIRLNHDIIQKPWHSTLWLHSTPLICFDATWFPIPSSKIRNSSMQLSGHATV